MPPIGKSTTRWLQYWILRGKSASSNSGGNNQSSNTYQKYRDAYKYQSGGAEEQRMVGDAVDAALEEGRLRRQRAAQRRASQSNYNSSAINYNFYNSALKKFKAENYRGAISDATAFIQMYPNGDADAWELRGLAKTWLKDFSGACFDLKRAADMGSQSAQKNLLKYCNPDGTAKKPKNDYESKPKTVKIADDISNSGKIGWGWQVKQVNKDCFILGSPELFGERLIKLKNEMWIKVNFSIKEGKYFKARRENTEGWIHSSWFNN